MTTRRLKTDDDVAFQQEAIRGARWVADVLMLLFVVGVFAWALSGFFG